MKKIININFQGRVIPIEETAFDILKQYIESLRMYFANEEGRDEIINDIESRIAELFSDRLKRADTCITDEDVNAVIASIGRPQDLEEAEGTHTSATGSAASGAGVPPNNQQGQPTSLSGRRLYRSQNDKILGGVASGLANYFGIDPSIMRLLFVLFLFMGFGFLLYIILWIVVPPKNLSVNVRKRLYRNPEHRMIGGVASGIAAYLNIDVWIPRLIFLAPFILGIFANFRGGWMHFMPGPELFFSGFGGAIMVIYIVLWIVLPQATTATEKLEMRGEKVDLESIKKTVKEDLESLKGRAEKVGGEMKERAQAFGQDIKQASQNFAAETGPAVRRSSSGLGNAIGVLFKAFFLFFAGIIVFSLLMALLALLFSGIGAFPFKDFLLIGFWQNFLAWSTLILFIGIPIIAVLTWLIRRIIGVKSRNHYLGYTFGSLWIIGLVSAITLTGLVAQNFRSKTSIKEEMPISQPPTGKLLVKVSEGKVNYGSDWFGFDGDLPFFSQNQDSITMKTIQVKVIRSADSLYHIYAVKFSNGNTPAVAENLATRISFPVSQMDSTVYLPKGFTITQADKFRNQQVMLLIEIPVGKKVEVDRSVDQYNWFTVNGDHRRGWNAEWDDRWNNSYYYNTNREYVMTPGGLEEVHKKENRKRNLGPGNDQDQIDEEGEPDPRDDGNYRYKNDKRLKKDSLIIQPKDTNKTATKTASALRANHRDSALNQKEEEDGNSPDSPTAFTLLMLFQ